MTFIEALALKEVQMSFLNSTSFLDFIAAPAVLANVALSKVAMSISDKLTNNIAALRIVKDIIANPRSAVTAGERACLNDYCGWGQLSGVFDPTHPRNPELKALLSTAEYRAVEGSVLTSYYTEDWLIDAMYRACSRLGVHEGHLLDPATGTGRFLARIPATMNSVRSIGIELDGLTGQIARLLNPSSKVYVNQPFESVKLPNTGDYSLVIGNPPYSSVKAQDSRFGKLNLHNYFMLRGINELHFGGLMAFVVSSWVMDSKDASVRQELSCFGDLVAACRLPNSIFAGEGANVVTDILIFQAAEYPKSAAGWLDVVELDDGMGGTYAVNRLFAGHPELVAGSMSAPTTFTRSCEVKAPDGELAEVVNQILDAQTAAPVFFRHETKLQARRGAVVAPAGMDSVGLYEYCQAADGQLYRRVADERDVNGCASQQFESIEPSREKDRLRILAMLRVKAALARLLDAEKQDANPMQIRSHRDNLNATYDLFVSDFGPFHAAKNKQVLSADPWYYRLRALEVDYCAPISKTIAEREGIEERAEKWEKSELFNRRIIKPVVLPTTAADLGEAVLLSVSYKGAVDLDYISRMVNYQGSRTELMAKLSEQGLAFVDPETGSPVYSNKYLSGFVRAKLETATEKAKLDPAFEVNVQHLSCVQPENIPAIDIFVPINAAWLPTSIHEAFIRHLAGDESLRVSVAYCLGKFIVDISRMISDTQNVSTWGTVRRPLTDLIVSLLNNSPVKVEDKQLDGTYLVNEQETLSAQHKADMIRNEWLAWVHDNAERREIIELTYNDKFNGFVAPRYDGANLPFAGASLDLYPTQKNAVMRGLMERAMLIDHAVGAGKTNTMIALAHMLRYINSNERVVLVAPNHLISQHAVAAQTLFPGLNVFVLDKKMMEPATRRAALARLSLCDFDLCIIPLSVFGLIPAPNELLLKLMEEEIDSMRAALMDMTGKKLPVRDLVKRIKDKETVLEEIVNKPSDDYLDFSDLRISTLIVDESQFGKNLSYSSSLSGVAGMGDPAGSKRAFDLFVKSRFVLDNGGRYVEATGTPILNSIVECHRHLRVFARQYTQDSGLTHFDAFSSVFAQPVTDYELAPSGRGYKLKTRISQFTNVTELQSIYSYFADVVTLEELPSVLPKLPDGRSAIPPLAGGKVRELLVQPNAHQDEGFKDIVSRFSNVDRHVNNPLKLMHTGRQLSMDARLVYPDAPDYRNSKINVVIDYIVQKYHETTAVKGTQLVFMDRSIPARHRASANKEWLDKLNRAKAGDDSAIAELDGLDMVAVEQMLQSSFSLYDEMVEKLIDRGIPASEIAVIHDYRTDAKKEMLRRKMNRGQIRVLIGSTELMGSGMNVNERLVSLIDVDLPLRPGDLSQRHGRIERQGNALWANDPSFEIEIVVPLTARTLDAWNLGLLNTKQNFITRFRQLDSSVRHYTEQHEVIDFAELSAIVADDPRILQHIRGKAQLRKLEAVKNNWFRNRAMLQDNQILRNKRIKRLQHTLPTAKIDGLNVDSCSAAFAVTIHGVTYTSKGLFQVDTDLSQQPNTAAVALHHEIRACDGYRSGEFELATYRGCKLVLVRGKSVFKYGTSETYVVRAQGQYDLESYIKTDTVNGILNAFEAFVNDLPHLPEVMQRDIERNQKSIDEMQVAIDAPFAQQAELDQMILQQQELESALALDRQNKAVKVESTTVQTECSMAA